MDEFLTRIIRHAQRCGLFAPGDLVVVGVSGGPDSLCLLHVLQRLSSVLGIRLHVAHLNHGLRGAESGADARFVAELAARWDLPCTTGQADVVALASALGLSLEEAARQARYRFLAEVAEAAGARTVAVGHNADDQAETVLMHFLRGSGVAGLRGMLARSRLSDYRLDATATCSVVSDSSWLWVVRPLLATPRAAIEAYCDEHGLEPRFDRSNEDTTIYRNRLRHELLPILASYNTGIREVLARTAEVMAGDHETLRAALDAAWDQVALPTGGQPIEGKTALREVQFDLSRWRQLPLGIQRAAVREAIHRLRHNLRNINWDHVERAVWLAREGQTGQSATLAAGLTLEIGYDTLRVGQETAPWTMDVPQISAPVSLNTPGVTSLEHGWQVVVSRLRRDELAHEYHAAADRWTAWLDAEVVGPALTLRPRKPGDRFQPHGLAGQSTKLNEFMINAKVPRSVRAGWPLLAGRAGLAWVCGLRTDERAIVRPSTTTVWRVRLVSGAADRSG